MVISLAAIGLAGSVAALAVAAGVFFAGYFVAYEPYRALYPDLLPDEVAGRSQSVQAGWRGLGTVLALASGGALLAIAKPLPFAVFSAALALSVGVFAALLMRGGYMEGDRRSSSRCRSSPSAAAC